MSAQLTIENLLFAYSHGIFPMADENGEIHWFEANPRGILPLERFHIPHDLKRILKQNRFQITFDADFEAVIRGCADRPEPTWISEEIISAYVRFHQAGFAHSVEAWQDGELVGGLYGVALGGAFFGESMFHRRRDASKVALCHLAVWLQRCEFTLFDIQMITDVLRRFGAVLIPRDTYLQRLQKAVSLPRRLHPSEIDWKQLFAEKRFR